LWDHLFPLEKEELIKLLIQKVEVREDGIDIEFKSEKLSARECVIRSPAQNVAENIAADRQYSATTR